MHWISDQDYLKNQQYQQPNNLGARILIHQRFSRNMYGWNRWVFDHLNLRAGMRVLELGCGTAALWRENLSRVPREVEVFLSDYSAGMLAEARGYLGGDERFCFSEIDAQSLPFADASFDLVVANHMLYHVPDIPRAIGEMRRVLLPGGHLAAATNGADHMMELYDLAHQFDSGIYRGNESAARFGLQNGDALLKPVFANRELFIYEDALWITEALPLVQYYISLWGMGAWDDTRKERLLEFLTAEIRAKGGIFIRKSTGLFWASRC